MDFRITREVASIVVLAAIPTLVAIGLDVVILTGTAPTVYVDTSLDRSPHDTEDPTTTQGRSAPGDEATGRGDGPGDGGPADATP